MNEKQVDREQLIAVIAGYIYFLNEMPKIVKRAINYKKRGSKK